MNSEFGIRCVEENGFGQLERDGFQILESVLGHDECDLLSAELTSLHEYQQNFTKSRIGGLRNLLATNSLVFQMAKSEKLLSILERFGNFPAFPVRAIFFDKNPRANWVVPWHQDLAIAVIERIETPRFSGWSVKDGVLHVHPPREILENMVTVRLHLDDCTATNGALKVLTGSHLHGKLSPIEITKWTDDVKPVICELKRGDMLLMRPLLLHASSQAEVPGHRRVLHIEYATKELPNGLKWFNHG